MITNYLSLEHETCVFSIKKSLGDEKCFDLRFDCENYCLIVSVKADFLKKINNVMRSVCYPKYSEERVKVCLNATASKSALENMQSAEQTSLSVMATFLKSLRVEDVAFGGTFGNSANTSTATTNSQDE